MPRRRFDIGLLTRAAIATAVLTIASLAVLTARFDRVDSGVRSIKSDQLITARPLFILARQP